MKINKNTLILFLCIAQNATASDRRLEPSRLNDGGDGFMSAAALGVETLRYLFRSSSQPKQASPAKKELENPVFAAQPLPADIEQEKFARELIEQKQCYERHIAGILEKTEKATKEELISFLRRKEAEIQEVARVNTRFFLASCLPDEVILSEEEKDVSQQAQQQEAQRARASQEELHYILFKNEHAESEALQQEASQRGLIALKEKRLRTRENFLDTDLESLNATKEELVELYKRQQARRQEFKKTYNEAIQQAQNLLVTEFLANRKKSK